MINLIYHASTPTLLNGHMLDLALKTQSVSRSACSSLACKGGLVEAWLVASLPALKNYHPYIVFIPSSPMKFSDLVEIL